MKIESQVPVNTSCMSKAFFPGAFVSIFSGIFLLILMLFWQKLTAIQVDMDGEAYFLMRALFFLSIIGFYVTFRFLRPFDPLGIREIVIHLKGKAAKEPVFSVRGTYRWVRHPLYFFSLLLIPYRWKPWNQNKQ